LDGVTFPAAEVALDFLQPVDTEREALFPTGKLVDQIDVAGIGVLDATMINAGIPTIFINASAIGYEGTELQEQINSDADALAKFERIRTAGALAMGLIATPEEAAARQHTPKVGVCCPCPRLYGFKR
jgi:2-methylaconitate cis-trans-isomerase PrpF